MRSRSVGPCLSDFARPRRRHARRTRASADSWTRPQSPAFTGNPSRRRYPRPSPFRIGSSPRLGCRLDRSRARSKKRRRCSSTRGARRARRSAGSVRTLFSCTRSCHSTRTRGHRRMCPRTKCWHSPTHNCSRKPNRAHLAIPPVLTSAAASKLASVPPSNPESVLAPAPPWPAVPAAPAVPAPLTSLRDTGWRR
jgi:hypothetical protein